jgi:hypothetical protein
MGPVQRWRQRKAAARLAAVKEWQAEERAAAVDRILDLATTTPDPVRGQR